MIVNVLVEGSVDEAVARRLITYAGHEFGVAYGKRGWTYIKEKIGAFNNGITTQALLVLVDFMDTGEACPPQVLRTWVKGQKERLAFRVVVREIESWIMADRENFARFLNVPLHRIPIEPEHVPDPKQTLINIARLSRTRAIRDAMIPMPEHSASVGPLYSSELIRFVSEHWNPEIAKDSSDSLNRCIRRLMELVD